MSEAENDNEIEDGAAVQIHFEGDGPFLFPRTRLLSVSLTTEDVIFRLATMDEQVVELPIAIGALPDLAMGVAAALKALRAGEGEPS